MERTAHVSLDFKRLTIPDKDVFGNSVIAALTANAGIFKNLPVSIADLQTINDALSDSAQKASSGDHQKVTAMHQAEKTWEASFGKVAEYVDGVANGNKNIIQLGGFKATETETSPTIVPGSVKFHVLKANPLTGSLHIEIDFMSHAAGYMYFISNTNTPPVFTNNQFSVADNPNVIAFILDTHRKVDFYNLPSKQAMFVSVAAFNLAGIGVLSQPVSVLTL